MVGLATNMGFLRAVGPDRAVEASIRRFLWSSNMIDHIKRQAKEGTKTGGVRMTSPNVRVEGDTRC